MAQAARSGRQNIAEGSMAPATSKKRRKIRRQREGDANEREMNRFAEKLARGLFDDERERARFLERLREGKARRLVRIAALDAESRSGERNLPDWAPRFVNLAEAESGAREMCRGAGAGYLLDLSSVWEASPLTDLHPAPRRTLDLCAAPGGKSAFCRRLWPEGELFVNEVVPRRLRVLRANLQRFGAGEAYAQRWTAEEWRGRAAGAFDLVLVDAPCSGQALVAKGIRNPGAFHPAAIRGSARRQRRILGAVADCVAPGGWLLYTTCTFSPEENEKTVEWMLGRVGGMAAEEVPKLRAFQVDEASFPCYRLYPQQGFGAGGFCCLLRREGERSAELPELNPAARAFPL
ncbi:MAG TPA: hypothetical protein VMN36_06330 [Verrucomicrobiales bacterium]|nr:hypothetical protein [Verrucomicrobiales bacterium]